MISLISIVSITNETDIYSAVVNQLAESEIDLPKLVSLITDGVCSMSGEENSFPNLLTTCTGHSILDFHCIIYQQDLLLAL